MIRMAVLIAIFGQLMPRVNAQMPKASELLDKYAETQDKLQSSFILKSKNTSMINAFMMGGQYKAREEEKSSFFDLRSDSNRVALRLYLWKGGDSVTEFIPKEKAGYISDIWDGKYVSSYARDTRSPKNDLGSVIFEKEGDDTLSKDIISIGYEGHEVLGIFFGDHKRIDSVLRKADSLSVRAERERIGNSDCYVVEASVNDSKYSVWINPKVGYNIVKATVKRGKNAVLYDRPQEQGRGRVKVFTSINNSHFKKISDHIWVPMESEIVINRNWDNDEFAYIKQHNKLIEITVDPNHNELGSFERDDIKNGATVVFQEAPGITYTWQDGKIVDIQGHEISLGSMKSESLMEKALPDLAEFDVDEPAQNRVLLVYFWDMNQRPSRDGLQKLTKRAEELKRKGVDVVAIHASKVEKNKLDTWVKKNHIPFSVGVVQSDETKTLQIWGVRALPWLILTDKEHIVRIEGFGIDELDKKIIKN